MAATTGRRRPGPAAAALEPSTPATAAPGAATDIIKWPPVLQESEFAYERAQIEAPYRRHPPGLSAPTSSDYRNMTKTAEQMKAILEWRLGQEGGLATDEYEQAKSFLSKLGEEASRQAEQATGPANPK